MNCLVPLPEGVLAEIPKDLLGHGWASVKLLDLIAGSNTVLNRVNGATGNSDLPITFVEASVTGMHITDSPQLPVFLGKATIAV